MFLRRAQRQTPSLWKILPQTFLQSFYSRGLTVPASVDTARHKNISHFFRRIPDSAHSFNNHSWFPRSSCYAVFRGVHSAVGAEEDDDEDEAGFDDGNVPSPDESAISAALNLIPGIKSYPPLLSARKNMGLLLHLGASPEEAAYFMKRQPSLLLYEATDDLLAKASLLDEYCGDRQLLLRMRHPLGSPHTLQAVLDFLMNELKFDKSEVAKLMKLEDLSLVDQDEASLRDVVACMRAAGIVDIKRFFKRFLMCPRYPHDWVARKLEVLRSFLPPNDLTSIVQRFPKILSAQVDVLKMNRNALVDLFGLEKAARMFRQHPALLTAAPSTIQTTYLELMLVFGEETALRMVVGQPGILCLSWERVSKKLDYLRQAMGRKLDEVASCPTFLMRSLDKCIKPRHLALKEWSSEFGLSYILGCKLTVFQERFTGIVDPDNAKAESARSERTKNLLLEFFGETGSKDILLKDPRLARINCSLLEAKLVYLEKEMERSRVELMASPQALQRSLHGCIMPRHKALGARAKNYRLNYIIVSSNTSFERRFGVRLPPEAYEFALRVRTV